MRERDSNSYIHEMDGFSVLFLGPQATLEMRHEELFLFQLHCFFFGAGAWTLRKCHRQHRMGQKEQTCGLAQNGTGILDPAPKKKEPTYFSCVICFLQMQNMAWLLKIDIVFVES